MFLSKASRAPSISAAAMVATASLSFPMGAHAEHSDSTNGEDLQEVVVTAQKRSERLTDVPEAVSVIGSDVLERRQITQLEDLFRFVPGVSFSSNGQAFSQLSMRGITTGGLSGSTGNTPTVAIYMDDVPLNSSTALSLGDTITPDLDPSDLDHIEVLKGASRNALRCEHAWGTTQIFDKTPRLD